MKLVHGFSMMLLILWLGISIKYLGRKADGYPQIYSWKHEKMIKGFSIDGYIIKEL